MRDVLASHDEQTTDEEGVGDSLILKIISFILPYDVQANNPFPSYFNHKPTFLCEILFGIN